MKTRILTGVLCFLLAAMLGIGDAAQAGGWDWDDIEAPYRHRLDTQTSSSGNAQRVNTVTHIATPWPRNVRNRHIPGNGERMVGAMRRYQDGGKERLPMAIKVEQQRMLEMPLEPPLRTFVKTNKSSGSSTSTGGMNVGGAKGAVPSSAAEMGKSDAAPPAAQPEE